MTLEGRKQKFEDWKNDPHVQEFVDPDATFIYFAMKRGDPFVQTAMDHLLFEGDWTKPALFYIAKHAKRLAANRGYDSVNEMIEDLGGVPLWATA